MAVPADVRVAVARVGLGLAARGVRRAWPPPSRRPTRPAPTPGRSAQGDELRENPRTGRAATGSAPDVPGGRPQARDDGLRRGEPSLSRAWRGRLEAEYYLGVREGIGNVFDRGVGVEAVQRAGRGQVWGVLGRGVGGEGRGSLAGWGPGEDSKNGRTEGEEATGLQRKPSTPGAFGAKGRKVEPTRDPPPRLRVGEDGPGPHASASGPLPDFPPSVRSPRSHVAGDPHLRLARGPRVLRIERTPCERPRPAPGPPLPRKLAARLCVSVWGRQEVDATPSDAGRPGLRGHASARRT